MKKCLMVLILTLVAGEILPVKAQDKETVVKVGDQVPEFEVTLFDGEKVKIKDLRGKVVLINFWATWCPPCQLELKRVQKEIIDRFKGKEFVFLAISREDSYEKIKEFREKNGYTFPMGLDTDRKIYSLFANSTIPRNFIIGKAGKIEYGSTGYSEKSFSNLVGQLETLLKDK